MSSIRRWQCDECASIPFPSPRWSPGPLKELDAGSVVDLLDDLDSKLARRGTAASLYVVGGSAMLLAHGRSIATPDVDIARTVDVATRAAEEIARERGLSMKWLNSAAAPWIPPRPDCALRLASRPGATVHLAPPRHLLAMKLVAWRPKDEDDLADLLIACDLAQATAEEVSAVLFEVYTAEDSLPGLLGIPRSDAEATRLEAIARARDALTLL